MMSEITIHNYEAYLLDFSEGNLSNELTHALELFLMYHPELDINLTELSLLSIEEEQISFSNKLSLKKTESDLISEEQFVAYIEHQLPSSEKKALEKSCSINPSLAKELALFQKTIFVADAAVVYQNKSALKRKSKAIWLNFSITQYAAAACVIFLIGLFMFWQQTNSINTSNLVANSKKDNNHIKHIKNEKPSLAFKEESTNFSPVKENPILIQKSNHSKTNIILTTNTTSSNTLNTITNIDTVSNTENSINISQNEPLIALNTTTSEQSKTEKQNNALVHIITETDDESFASNNIKKKNNIWATASQLLKNLNNAGVKSVNSDEDSNKEKSSYALTLGNVRITHKTGL